MKCIECGTAMDAGPVTLRGRYRGEDVSVDMEEGYGCPKCGYATIHGKHSATFSERLKEKYRETNNRLRPQDYKAYREALGASQDKYAAFLKVGPASVKRWESGLIPEAALEELVRWKSDPHAAEVALQDAYFRMYTLKGSLKELPDIEAVVSRAVSAWAGPVGRSLMQACYAVTGADIVDVFKGIGDCYVSALKLSRAPTSQSPPLADRARTAEYGRKKDSNVARVTCEGLVA